MRDALHWEKTGKCGIFPKSLSVLWTALPSMSVRFVQSFFIIIPKEENFCKYKMFQPPWDRRVNVETDDEHLGLLCHIRGPHTTRQCNHLEPGFQQSFLCPKFHFRIFIISYILLSRCCMSNLKQNKGDSWEKRIPHLCQWHRNHGTLPGRAWYYINLIGIASFSLLLLSL